MSIILSKTFISPYPDVCPEWCKKGTLVKRTKPMKSALLGEYKGDTIYEIIDLHWFDKKEAKGIWACAYLRPKGTEGRWTAAEYICDLEHIDELP